MPSFNTSDVRPRFRFNLLFVDIARNEIKYLLTYLTSRSPRKSIQISVVFAFHYWKWLCTYLQIYTLKQFADNLTIYCILKGLLQYSDAKNY